MIQYIANAAGETTGVYIPIIEWEKLKIKFADLEKEIGVIPDWHREILDKRLAEYKNNPKQVLDFETVMTKIESQL